MGDKRVGIARGSGLARIAQPLKTVAASQAVGEIKEISRQNGATAIVVGLPRSLDGSDTEQTQKVREWADSARKEINLPFYWQDEALTSRTARQQGGTDNIDAEAAAIILQDFLDSPAEQRVRC